MVEFGPKDLKSKNEPYSDQGVIIADIIDTEREIPPQTPFQEASVLEPDVVLTPIPIEADYISSEREASEATQPPVHFYPFGRTVTLPIPAAGPPMIKPVLLVEGRAHAQSVTIISAGTAASIDIGFLTENVVVFPAVVEGIVPASDWQFAVVVTIPAGSLPLTFTLGPNQHLWAIQYTAVAQNVCLTVGAHLVAE